MRIGYGKSIAGCRWVFTMRNHPVEHFNARRVAKGYTHPVKHFKARLVAKRYTHTYGMDYAKTFSPIAKIVSIQILISPAANLSWLAKTFLIVKNVFVWILCI